MGEGHPPRPSVQYHELGMEAVAGTHRYASHPPIERPTTVTEPRRAREHRLPDADALALQTEYRRTGDSRLRDRLVIAYAGIVKHIVYRKLRELPAWCEVDDLLSCGLEALIAAVDRFDPQRGRPSSSTRGPASTAPCSTSCGARTGRRDRCAAGSATSRRRGSTSARSTAAPRPTTSWPMPWASTASTSTGSSRTSRHRTSPL